jgi:NAD(P)-dependent dehydrogenase (short-subunit alcohol dehydrogenase family)
MRPMKGRICLVTGVTAGIGKVTARALAGMGATVVAVARDAARGQAVVEEIRRETGNGDVHLRICDVSSQADIRRFVAGYRETYDRLHVLVNNAGAVFGERTLTVDGIERTIATNHLGYFLLTELLLDVLKASAPARVVSVASTAHRGASLDLDDLQFERRAYTSLGVYGASKLANVIWSAELARRLEGSGVTANSLHPGVIASNFGASGPGWMQLGVKLIRPFLISSEKGAETSIYLASSPQVEKETGKYFDKKKAIAPDRRAGDLELRRRLWAISEELTAERPGQAKQSA